MRSSNIWRSAGEVCFFGDEVRKESGRGNCEGEGEESEELEREIMVGALLHEVAAERGRRMGVGGMNVGRIMTAEYWRPFVVPL